MMREMDTVSPVVWPAWCYSGGQPESESVASADVLQPRPQPLPPSSMALSTAASSVRLPPTAAGPLGGGASAHRKRRTVPRSYESPTTALNGAHAHGARAVKSERLSPSGAHLGDSASTSSLSRSGTPSSPPASHPAPTSPVGSPSRTSNNNNSTLNNNNISSHLKAMEDSVTHNYSDFIRNLAAKYQYVHPDEFYNGATRNGFPAALDPRFPYKSAAPFLMPPLGGSLGQGLGAGLGQGLGAGLGQGLGAGVLPVPPGVVSPLHHLTAPAPQPAASSSKDSSSSSGRGGGSRASDRASDRDREDRDAAANSNHSDGNKATAKSPPSSDASNLLFSPLYVGGTAGLDMSSTQALVSMVQRSHQNQLETYLKGANKRPAEASPLSPLDLSSGAPTKKGRKGRDARDGDLYGVDSLLGLPSNLIRSSKERLATRTPPSRALSSPRLAAASTSPAPGLTPGLTPGSPKSGGNPLSCSALCSTTPGHASVEGPCGASDGPGAASIAHWSVGDVCNFVQSIDICVEYVQAFREQRIDGSALPLLTEEHLRTQMKMRLGPALKLRAVLAKRLGHCSVCLHCVHCHSATPASTSNTSTSTPSSATSVATARSSPSPTPSGSATPVNSESCAAPAGLAPPVASPKPQTPTSATRPGSASNN